MDFLIIGGDAAGMSAASRAKRLKPDLKITVLEQTQDVSYSACGMPYNIADPERPIDDLVVRSAEVFRSKQGIDVRLGHTATRIDPAARLVHASTPHGLNAKLPYDRLLIATGARPLRPEIPGIDQPGVFALKSLSDGRRIKDYLKTQRVAKVVIIGMGYIALEMCEALTQRGIKVDLIKPRPRLLPWMPAELAATVQASCEAAGANLFPGSAIQRIERSGDHLMVVGDGLMLRADMILVATGVTPNSELAHAAGLALGPAGSIAVGRSLQTSDGAIYAAGDCADAFHRVSGKRTWIPLALRANRAGWAVADNVCGIPTELPGIVGTAVFKVMDLEVARTGLSLAEAEAAGFNPRTVTISSRSRAHAHAGAATIQVYMVADKSSGRLLGAQMVGSEGVAHRINAAAVALQGQMTVAEFSQADLAYAPPFGPVWDPLLTAANQLKKRL
jgi:NADPH-dependent 2,4-dienoyl-CoA reductase/sulfur reductase-like enzyme